MNGLLPSLRYGNPENNITLHNELASIVSDAINKHFENYDFVANHFITKTAFDTNEFRLHQDWNVVDERKYIAAHIWCPLQETNESNGGLFAVKGSHLFFKNFRSGSLGLPFIDSTERVKNHITSFKLLPGEAVAYNQCLFHGSYPNHTEAHRQVVLISIKPKEAAMMYFHKENISANPVSISAYEINSEILFEQISALEKGAEPSRAIRTEKIIYEGLENCWIKNAIFESNLSD